MNRPALQAGLRGLAAHLHALTLEQFGFHVRLSQQFWKPVCRALELCTLEQCAAKLATDEAGGRGDAAFAAYQTAVIGAVEKLGITAAVELKLVALILNGSKAGLAALVPAVTEGG